MAVVDLPHVMSPSRSDATIRVSPRILPLHIVSRSNTESIFLSMTSTPLDMNESPLHHGNKTAQAWEVITPPMTPSTRGTQQFAEPSSVKTLREVPALPAVEIETSSESVPETQPVNEIKSTGGDDDIHAEPRKTKRVLLEPNPAPVSTQIDESELGEDESHEFSHQAVLFLTDISRREALATRLGSEGMRTVQVEDLVTAYAVVTRLVPEIVVVDPCMCFDANWKDLKALRKFTREQSCALFVMIADPSPELIDRLADLGADHVSLCTDPIPLLSLAISRLVTDRRRIKGLKETLQSGSTLNVA